MSSSSEKDAGLKWYPITVKDGTGVIHPWAVWIGSATGSTPDKNIYISIEEPPLKDGTVFNYLGVAAGDDVVCSFMVQQEVEAVILNSNNSIVVDIIEQCQKLKLLPHHLQQSSQYIQQLTPTKSPVAKKARPCGTSSKKSKTSLFPGSPSARNPLQLLADAAISTRDSLAEKLNEEEPEEIIVLDDTTQDSIFNLDNFPDAIDDVASSQPITSDFMVGKLTQYVKVTNVSMPLFKNHFLHWLNNEICKAGLASACEKHAISCSDGDNNSVIVEFTTPRAAERTCAITEWKYGDDIIYMQQQREENSPLEVTECFLPLDGNATSIPTACVLVSNLEEPVFKDHFLHSLNNQMCEAGLAPAGESVIVCCSPLSDGSAVIEFATSEAARRFCDFAIWTYDGKLLSIRQLRDKVARTEANELSSSVEVTNVPCPFFKEHFLHFLNREMWKRKLVPEGETCAVSCKDNEESTTIVEFGDAATASLTCSHLENLFYDGMKLTLKQLRCSAPVNPAVPPITAPSTVEESAAVTMAVLKECVDIKTGPKFKATTPVMEKVCTSLHRKGHTGVTVEMCKKIIRRLNDQHRRNPARNEWSDSMAYLRGECAIRPPIYDHTTTPEASVQPRIPVTSAEAFVRHSNFSNNSEANKALISILQDKKSEYKGVHKDAEFWGSVSKEMCKEGHFWATPPKCKAQASSLEGMYKSVEKGRSRTGAGGVKWEYYKTLEELHGDSVTTQPLKTLSAGGVATTTVNKRLMPDADVGASFRKVDHQGKTQKFEVLKALAESRTQLCKSLDKMSDAMNNCASNSM